MGKRLGSGEYERADVDVKQSTIEARYKFLQTLSQRKSKWGSNLLRLFNHDAVPGEFLETEKIDATVYFFLQYLTSKNPYETEIRPEIINVPLINFYRYLFDKENEIKELENDEELDVLDSSELTARRRNAIKKIVPSWRKLRNRADAKALCQSLETWAESFNLNSEWLLDFALSMLCAFKAEFDFKLTNYKSDQASFWQLYYGLEIKDATNTAISDYSNNEVWTNKLSGFDDMGKIPEFEYRWRDFIFPSSTWLPRTNSRQDFVKEMNEKLLETINYLHKSKNFWNYSNDVQLNYHLNRCRKYIESYCDQIEKQKSERIDESNFLPFDYNLVKATWFPSKKTRKHFVEENIAELKIQIVNINKAVESLKDFTKKDFRAKLTEYCNKIEKSLPENWKKTPQKYSETRHFEWLVDYQITPFKSPTEIAKENNVGLKTVRGAIIGLAEMIGITLRKTKPTGRPKGSKDSDRSLRKIGIYRY
jgi:hypothetical protein